MSKGHQLKGRHTHPKWWFLFKILSDIYPTHDDVIKWKHFLHHWPLCREFTSHRWKFAKFCLGLSLLRVKLHRQTGLLCLSSRLFEHKMSKPFWGLFYEHGWALIPEWIDNYIYYNVWDEITYPFLNSTVRLLKFGKGLVISSHILLGM